MRGITRAGQGAHDVGRPGPAGAPGREHDRWTPALVSGLVLPGLGQLALGRPWRALAFSASSLGLVSAVLVRVAREAQRLMPADPEELVDPALPFRLVAEIHRANASFFFWCTLGIVAVWAWAVLDCVPKGPRG